MQNKNTKKTDNQSNLLQPASAQDTKYKYNHKRNRNITKQNTKSRKKSLTTSSICIQKRREVQQQKYETQQHKI